MRAEALSISSVDKLREAASKEAARRAAAAATSASAARIERLEAQLKEAQAAAAATAGDKAERRLRPLKGALPPGSGRQLPVTAAGGKTPLAQLAAAGSVDAARLLIDKAVTAVALDVPCDGETPLHIACAQAPSTTRDDMITLLVCNGAARNARCGDGRTPLLLLAAGAVEHDAKATLSAMEAVVAPLSVKALRASKKLSVDGDVNAARQSDGMTALMLLAGGGGEWRASSATTASFVHVNTFFLSVYLTSFPAL